MLAGHVITSPNIHNAPTNNPTTTTVMIATGRITVTTRTCRGTPRVRNPRRAYRLPTLRIPEDLTCHCCDFQGPLHTASVSHPHPSKDGVVGTQADGEHSYDDGPPVHSCKDPLGTVLHQNITQTTPRAARASDPVHTMAMRAAVRFGPERPLSYGITTTNPNAGHPRRLAPATPA